MTPNITSQRWRRLTLPRQFLLAGAAVMIFATVFVEYWVSERIQAEVVENSAISAALLMESYISPLSQDLSQTNRLSPEAIQTMSDIFDGTSLGDRVVSFKIWTDGGMIVHASDPALIGQVFEPSDDLLQAWQGQIAAAFEDLSDEEDAREAALGIPLLEVYSPIRQAWTGEVIAVAEFYEDATELDSALRGVRHTSWLVVGGAFLISGILLFGIVQAGGRTIRNQQMALSEQLDTTRKFSAQNAELRRSVVAASARATAQTERAIRRVGSDLHDGPAQYLSLAALRLEGALDQTTPPTKDAVLVRNSLGKALEELRIISRGLALPDLDNLSTRALIERAAKDHGRQTDMTVDLTLSDTLSPHLNYAQKLCIFRFLQEALSNASRHAKVDEAQVHARSNAQSVTITVTDQGRGFDPSVVQNVRDDGGQGLLGLSNRAGSIGGTLNIESSPTWGTKLTLTLPLEDTKE